jgi:hypothetical protein
MTYASPTVKVVTGFSVAYFMYFIASDVESEWFLVTVFLFLVGLAVLVEGLFSGIERAVANGVRHTETETAIEGSR